MIDCAAIFTIFAVQPHMRMDYVEVPKANAPHHPYRATLGDLDDVDWKGRCGRLLPLAVENLNSGLQVLVGGAIGLSHWDGELPTPFLPYKEGDVLQMNLPHRPKQLCLVVSSTCIDVLREHLTRKRRWNEPDTFVPAGREGMESPWPIGHITVVPLILQDQQYPAGEAAKTYKLIELEQCNGARSLGFAICQEIYTVDWRARMGQRVGLVNDESMSEVRHGLRYYLELPDQE
ncbi:hypothetical protein KF840_19355 [bacterium]|nr:hypothetical protein [bacterium]